MTPTTATARQLCSSAGTCQHWRTGGTGSGHSLRGAGYENSIYVLYGAYGMRDGVVDEVDNAIRAGLQNCLACDRQTLSSGQDWISLVAALPADPKVYPYTTWVDGPVDADDSSVDRSRWSPAKYLAWVAEQTGRRIGGENAGDAGADELQRAFAHLQGQDLVALYWYSESQLVDGQHVTLDDLKSAIAMSRR